ncbi:MAG: glycosyltransferase, partial [Gemmatimonadota bacterium]
RTLLASHFRDREIVLVDDRSEDGTRELAHALAERSGGAVRVVDGEPLPDGWVGKPWACWQGYRAACGELLLFTDADTRHGPDLLGHAVGALEAERADFLSVLPYQRMKTFWERVVLPMIGLVIRLRYPRLERVNRNRDPARTFANGQFILVRREAYEAVGGHEAVRGEIVEDVGLAQRFVAAGRRVFMAHAERLMETRMYRSLAGIVEGWSKNLALGSRLVAPPALRPAMPWIAVAGLVLVWIAPPVALAASILAGPGPLRTWAIGATAASVLYWAGVYLVHRESWLYALLYPLGAGVAAWLFVRSARLGERVEWKGRRYGRGGEVVTG